MGGRAAIFLALAVFAAGCAAPAPSDSISTNSAADTNAIPSDDLIVKELTSDVAGLDYISETDASYDVLIAPGAEGAVDADMVRGEFNRPALVDSEVRDFDDWFANDLALPDGADDTARAYVAQMTMARDTMRENLSDLTVVLLSENPFDDGDSVGELEIFIVGRSRTTGSLVALHTNAVWT